MALRGLKVLEFAGLAPAPYCGMILSDFGAKVTRIDKVGSAIDLDVMSRGKRSIAVNLKHSDGVNTVKQLTKRADVLIEPFRKGVMEKLGLGPEILMKDNPALIYSRLTGYGQNGPHAHKAGHDINYIALSGVLSMLGRSNEMPHPPVNLLADFAGGGMICAMGILTALFERSQSGKGQVIDANMVEGSAYIASWLWKSKAALPALWGNSRGENVLDGGAAFYNVYKTKDGKYMSVGAIEPKFYADLLKGLGLTDDDAPQQGDQAENKNKFEEIFLTKTRDDWNDVFQDLDACVEPILDFSEANTHPHNKSNESFIDNAGNPEPKPAPRLLRTPAIGHTLPRPGIGQHTRDVLLENYFSESEISKLLSNGSIEQTETSKL